MRISFCCDKDVLAKGVFTAGTALFFPVLSDLVGKEMRRGGPCLSRGQGGVAGEELKKFPVSVCRKLALVRARLQSQAAGARLDSDIE